MYFLYKEIENKPLFSLNYETTKTSPVKIKINGIIVEPIRTIRIYSFIGKIFKHFRLIK